MVTIMQTCVGPQGYFPAASVDPTEARNDIRGCFGRSDRSALRQSDRYRLRSATRLSSRAKLPAG
jgi:hypothetical protein